MKKQYDIYRSFFTMLFIANFFSTLCVVAILADKHFEEAVYQRLEIVSAALGEHAAIGDYRSVVEALYRISSNSEISIKNVVIINKINNEKIYGKSKLDYMFCSDDKIKIVGSNACLHLSNSILLGLNLQYDWLKLLKSTKLYLFLLFSTFLTFVVCLIFSFNIRSYISNVIFQFNDVLKNKKSVKQLGKEYLSLKVPIENLFLEIKQMKNRIQDQAQEIEKTKIARQVAHDIRSPLMAMEIVINSGSELTYEKKELLRNVMQRIKDIAKDLLDRNKMRTSDSSQYCLKERKTHYFKNLELSSKLVLSTCEIVKLKRLEYNSSDLQIKLYKEVISNFEVTCDLGEYERILSNIINNSVEAMNGQGLVTVDIFEDLSSMFIEVRDNGCGIPDSVIDKVFDNGFSFGKTNGTGLGLYYAQKCIEIWGGTLSIFSRVNQGSKVTMSLKKSKNS